MWLYQRVAPAGALNWRELVTGITPVSGGGGNPVAGQNCVFWDYANNVWIVPAIDGNYPTVDGAVPLTTSGFDDANAAQWYQFGGSSGPTFGALNNNDFISSMALLPDNVTYLASIVSPGAARTRVVKGTTTSGTWSNSLGPFTSTTITSCNMVGTFLGNVVAGFGGGPSDTIIYQTADGITWNAQVAVGAIIGGAAELLVKTGIISGSAGFMVIPMTAASLETGTQFAYWTSTVPATTWTQRTLSGVISSSEVPQGLAFGSDGLGPCWILATIQGTTQTNYYRSSDGLAWSFIGSTTTRFVQDLACIGSLWVATVADASATSPPGPIYGAVANPVYGAAGASYTIFSTDGAHTWNRSQGILSKNLTSTGRQQRAKLFASNQQFCLFNSLQLRFSNALTAVPFP